MRRDRLERSGALKERIAAELSAALAPQLAYLRAIRDVLPDDGVFVDELTQVGYCARTAYETRKPRTFVRICTLAWLSAFSIGLARSRKKWLTQ